MKKKVFALTTVFLSLFLSLLVLEVSVKLLRLVFQWDSKTPRMYDLSFPSDRLLPKRESLYSLQTTMDKYVTKGGVRNERILGDVDQTHAFGEKYIILDDSGLYYPRPDQSSRAYVTELEGGRIVYDVTYTIDEYGRRVTPHVEKENRDFFVALMGDSYVFGEGVENDETLPSYMAQQTQKTMFYNMGFHGYGPNSLLARALKKPEFFQGIIQSRGIGAYLFDPSDIARTIGTMSLISDWGRDLSEFTFEEQGPVFQGSFGQNYKNQIRFYKWFSELDTVQVLGLDWPMFYLPSHFEKVGDTIEALKNEFMRVTNARDFIVIIIREFDSSNRVYHKMMDHLDQRGINYLDYTQSDISQISQLPLYIDYEGHPRPHFYKIFSKILVNDLELE